MKTRRQLLMPSAEQVRSSISVLHEGGTLSSGLTSQMQQAMRNFMRANPNLGTRRVTSPIRMHSQSGALLRGPVNRPGFAGGHLV